MTLVTQPSLTEKIKEVQREDTFLQKIREEVEAGLRQDIVIYVDGLLRFGSKLCVPSGEVQRELLSKAHSSPHSVHPKGTKMHKVLKQCFWWHELKRKIARFVAPFLKCQQVKAEH